MCLIFQNSSFSAIQRNKICPFIFSLAFILFTFGFMAKFLKWTAGIGLPSRKREATKMGVSTDSAWSPLSYFQNITLQVVLNREALWELCCVLCKTLMFLTYDPLFLFVLLHPLWKYCRNSQKRRRDIFSIRKVYVLWIRWLTEKFVLVLFVIKRCGEYENVENMKIFSIF